MYEEFAEPMVWDYPEPPEEKPGKYECSRCGSQIYEGDEYAFNGTEKICMECLKECDPEDIYDIAGASYDPVDLYNWLSNGTGINLG